MATSNEELLEATGLLFLGILILVGSSFLTAILTKWGWNYGLAPAFHLSEITFWQGFFLNMFMGMVGRGFQSGFQSDLKVSK